MARLTIYDIAEKAGVSPSTVSRALQDHPRIGENTKGRIQALAKEMGYVPSAVARGLKTKRSRVLGVIVHRIEDPYLTEVLKGIEDTLHSYGYSLFLAATQRIPEREQEVIRAMNERRVDGIIISSSHINMKRLRQLDHYGIPSVLINNQETLEPDTCSVYNDEIYSMNQILQHVIGLGHKRIAYLGSPRAGRTNKKRQQGYEEALREAGVEVCADYISNGVNARPQGGAQAMRELLALEKLPTAVVCYNDMMAIGAIQAINQANLCVPDDVSVTGFDNIDLAAYVTPPLTTFHQPRYKLGQQAAEMMLQALNGEPIPAQTQVSILRGELVIRQSTASPN
ncbi:MAG: LacI family DNA-binding transcriptional regulator [Ardenticatenaceae bacterium]|nr:LacI family DNA-binding transcriptional regulator [Ardenticatenaceae bacterium]